MASAASSITQPRFAALSDQPQSHAIAFSFLPIFFLFGDFQRENGFYY